jgi:hypothetical protein
VRLPEIARMALKGDEELDGGCSQEKKGHQRSKLAEEYRTNRKARKIVISRPRAKIHG